MTRISFNVSLLGGKFALNLNVLVARNGSDAQDQFAGNAGLDQCLCILDSIGGHGEPRTSVVSLKLHYQTYIFILTFQCQK